MTNENEQTQQYESLFTNFVNVHGVFALNITQDVINECEFALNGKEIEKIQISFSNVMKATEQNMQDTLSRFRKKQEYIEWEKKSKLIKLSTLQLGWQENSSEKNVLDV